MPGVNPDNAEEACRAALSGLLDINSTDPTEGMLAAQIIAAHEAAMHLRQLAWHPEQSFEAMTKFLELAASVQSLPDCLQHIPHVDAATSGGSAKVVAAHK